MMTDFNSHKTAGDAASDIGSAPRSQASIGSSQPSEHGSHGRSGVLDHARGVASQVAGQAKDRMRNRIFERTSRSASEIGELAHALRETGKQLEQNATSPLIERAADQLGRVAELLETTDPDAVVRNVESFARREPLLFLGGAFVLGLAGARFLKSSAMHVAPSATAMSSERGQFDPGMGFRP